MRVTGFRRDTTGEGGCTGRRCCRLPRTAREPSEWEWRRWYRWPTAFSWEKGSTVIAAAKVQVMMRAVLKIQRWRLWYSARLGTQWSSLSVRSNLKEDKLTKELCDSGVSTHWQHVEYTQGWNSKHSNYCNCESELWGEGFFCCFFHGRFLTDSWSVMDVYVWIALSVWDIDEGNSRGLLDYCEKHLWEKSSLIV